MGHLVIRNDRQLTAALERAEALKGCADDSDEELELATIAKAVRLYAEMLALIRLVGRKVSSETKDSVASPTGTE